MTTKENECNGENCSSCAAAGQQAPQSQETLERELEKIALAERMGGIKHKVLVLSGKGGVGKSTVAVNLAMSLSLSGFKVGLLDVDIHGPSVPGMLNLEGRKLDVKDGVIQPTGFENLKVMSLGFLLQNADDAIIWRGPMKMGVIEQLLRDVAWGELDYLVVDCPPGTGDEPLSTIQLIKDVTGAVIVTTPQEVALTDVRKSVNFCHTLKVPVLGVVENMSGFVCPCCGEVTEIFKSGGGERMSEDMQVPFLGRVPVDPHMVDAGDTGKPFVYYHAKTETAKAFGAVVEQMLQQQDAGNNAEAAVETQEEQELMKIAIPVAEGRLAMHFGHCQEFRFIDVDVAAKKILSGSSEVPPPHEPGVLPKWLHDKGVNMIIAGGMGSRAQSLFAENQITVVVGAAADDPVAIVQAYLDGALQTGDNVCDH